jgi:hypothetical protein
MSPQELGAFICDAQASAIQRDCLRWMGQSPAFRTFVAKYRDKIRAKVRGCPDEDDLQDLLWELEIGHLLLKNPDFQLEYEPFKTHWSRGRRQAWPSIRKDRQPRLAEVVLDRRPSPRQDLAR